MNENRLEVDCRGMTQGTPPEPCIVVIFGASGDLTRSELIPSLYALGCQNLLPKQFAIVGFGRTAWDDETFRQEMREAIQEKRSFRAEAWEGFVRYLNYVQGDYKAPESYDTLRERIKERQAEHHIPDNILFHLAVPPSLYTVIVERLGATSLAKSNDGWRHLVIEKPFGQDETSARKLDRAVLAVFDESQVYRVDHYLGKETVQNMLVFRFANPGFEPIWNRNYIDHVQVTVAEDKGIGTRGGFYEGIGVVRDMVQNHLLQLLCMTAIEPPVRFDAASLHTETLKVLDAVRSIDVQEAAVRGQYGAGEIDGHQGRAYREEEQVADDSTTPTFVALKLILDNWRWADVPFYLRTGKRLAHKLTEVTIHFKPTPHLMFPINTERELSSNKLTFRLQPNEGILYTFLAKQPGAELCLRPVTMHFRYDTAFGVEEPPSAYEWLLLDAMQGDQTLFPSTDWIYRAWSIVDPLIKYWESEPPKDFPNYAAGTWGPVATDQLIRRDGREWNSV